MQRLQWVFPPDISKLYYEGYPCRERQHLSESPFAVLVIVSGARLYLDCQVEKPTEETPHGAYTHTDYSPLSYIRKPHHHRRSIPNYRNHEIDNISSNTKTQEASDYM
ncbi:hypothetical protein ACJQWK_00335 [Exserohilum turcicum]